MNHIKPDYRSPSQSNARKPNKFRRHYIGRVEELESRLAPATITWTGLGPDANWNTPTNWLGNVAPTGLAANVEDLVFPNGPSVLATINNLMAGSVFNSITIGASGYTLSGNDITLGLPAVSGSGSFIVNAGAVNNVVSLNTKLGASAGSDQSFSINFGATLTVTGKISGATGSTLTRDGIGTLILTNDNSGFTGSIRANNNSGAIVVRHPNALGDTSSPTIIGSGSSLRIDGAGKIAEPLILNGFGVNNDGALLNLAGDNVWTGTILLDSNAAIGSKSGTLAVASVISDSGSGRDLFKEGPGEVLFTSAVGNSYRGFTTVNDGTLTLAHPLALGAAGTPLNGTLVNQTLTGAGQIRIADFTGTGFTIRDESLTLNGPGRDGLGSLSNTVGNNFWAGPVTLGSPSPNGKNVTIGAADATDLTVSGIVASPNGMFNLVKVDEGRLVFNNANTYTGFTTVAQGTLTIRDSKGLGTTVAGTAVNDGATLELEVEAAIATPRFDAQGRDLWADSVTNDANRLKVSEPLTISGRGLNEAGALLSSSGINIYSSSISLQSAQAAIGVAQDLRPGHPSPDSSYFVNDYSLTTTNTVTGTAATDFVKRGAGHLIFPIANPYLGKTFIEQGWVTVQNVNALGGRLAAVSDTIQPGTFVNAGAALHIKPLVAGVSSMTFLENLTISGTGPAHPYAFINNKGALVNLGGNNVYAADIGLRSVSGIGVEQVDPITPSDLVVTGSTYDGKISTQFTANGFDAEVSKIIDTGSLFGTISVTYEFYSVPDLLRVYYPPRALGGTTIIDTGIISGGGTVTATYGPGVSTLVEVVMNEGGGDPGTVWDLFDVSISSSGGIVKRGSKMLTLQADGTYSNITQVAEGTLRAQHDTALGEASSGTFVSNQQYIPTDTVVSPGAVLELTTSVAPLNGGIASGLQIANESLTLNSPGQQVGVAGGGGTFSLSYGGVPTGKLPITATSTDVQNALNLLPTIVADVGSVSVSKTGNVYVVTFGSVQSKNAQTLVGTAFGGAEIVVSGGNASLVNLAEDNTWRGPVTLLGSSRVSISADTRLTLLGAIGDAANPLPAGSDFVKRGPGELLLAGASDYRGATVLDEGTTTIANSRALGSSTGGTTIANGAQLQLQGSLTIAGEALSLQGTGPGAIPAFPVRWLNVGPAPVNNSQVPNTLPSTGRVTGIAVDPSDSNVIYVATAGGGAWKSKNGGYTWLPLFDATVDPAAVLVGGSIAIAPSDPKTVYFATGEANNVADSYAGTGVYKSTDAGQTWALVTSTTGLANPLSGQSIAKIVVHPTQPNTFYAATSTLQTNAVAARVPGIWRHDGTNYFNMTSVVSTNRATVFGQAPFGDPATAGNFGPPNSPGPDDDYRLEFPQSQATWSDVAIIGGTLYVALGQATGASSSPRTFLQPAVYRTANLTGTTPIWFVGTPPTTTPDNRTAGAYPTNFTATPRNFNIKIAGSGTTIYGVNVNPATGALLDIQRTANGGQVWAAVTNPPAYFGTTGRYNTAIAVSNGGTTVTVAGFDRVFQSTNSGGAWTDISVDPLANGPHTAHHALVVDSSGTIYDGNDGGIWKLENSLTWKNLNGNLRTLLNNSVDSHPTDFRIGLDGAAANGTNLFTGDAAWLHVDDGNGGVVRYNQQNPSLAYHVRDGSLRKSTDGGATWNDILTGLPQYFPFLVDSVNSSRLLVGGSALRESINDGVSFTSLAGGPVAALAAATYQGPFQPDPAFPLVTDRQSNTYDPDTIYITDGTTIQVTKNHGNSWVTRTAPGTGTIIDMVVDPRSRDTVYVVRNSGPGLNAGQRVYRTIDAGRNWTNITGNLPALPTWKLAVDPRSGTLYVGNDDGVYVLPNGAGTTWSRFGAGLPHVGIRDIALNQSLNTLTIGTYGRSVYQLFLPDNLANSGALRVVSGSSVWTGPVTLAGNTTISVVGNQTLQNGIGAASLNIVGVVSDSPAGGNHQLVKRGQGTLTLSGSNTYGGQTQVQEGVLQVNNPRALGAATAGGNTAVTAGAALELRSDLELEPVIINGDGFKFNDHFTGALRNVSNNNTYTGPLTLGTDTTIGIDSGSSLRIGASKTIAGTGTIVDGGAAFGFVKESLGILTLGAANSYDGFTLVRQGALRVEHADALGTPGQGTRVLDGAQVQISRDAITQAPTAVTAEPLSLSGTGIFNTGSLLNVRADTVAGGLNDNAWRGPILFTVDPNTFPATNPNTQIAIGVSDSRDSLTLDASISEAGALASFGLVKVGPGRLTLSKANSYTGFTNVAAGTLRIRDANALGPVVSSEVQTINVFGTVVNYTLRFNGQTTAPIAATDSAAQVQLALSLLNTIGFGNVIVSETPSVSGKVLTVTFVGALANQDVPLLIVANGAPFVSIGTTSDGGRGTAVAVGATLEIDGDPTGIGASIAVNELLNLQGDGVGNTGALLNVSGNNVYAGPITLGASSTLGAAAGSQLTVTTPLQDPSPVQVPSPRLRKTGPGTVVFPTPNLYGGQTNVDEGVLRITTPLALGVGRNEIQRVAIYGTTFTLTFNGQTTGTLDATSPTAAADAQLALNLLASIGGVGGNVLVNTTSTPGGLVYSVQFGGTLANVNVTPLAPTAVAAAFVSQQTFVDGFGPEVQNVQVIGSNGTFTLSYLGVPTAALPFNATAADVQTALNAVSTIAAGGGVRVFAIPGTGSTTFAVAFIGAGFNANLQPMTSSTTGATIAIVTTAQDGPEGTTVANGATLQIAGGFSFANEFVTINGAGVGGQGALNNLSGNNTWAIPLILGSKSTIGTTVAGESLTFVAPIRDNGNAFNVDIVGPGTVVYANAGDNQYTGTTTVQQGVLLLSQSAGVAILGPLFVGNDDAFPATVRETVSNQIGNTVPVTVNSDGTFDLNSLTDTFGKLTVNGGSVLLGTGGSLTTADVLATGGSIAGGANAKLTSQNVTLTTGAAVMFGDAAQMAAKVLTVSGSSITFGANGSLKTDNASLTNASGIQFGDGGQWSALVTKLNASTATAGANFTLSTQSATLENGSKVQLGASSSFTTNGNTLTMTGSSALAIATGTLATGDASVTNSSVDVGGNWTSGITKVTNGTATVTGLTALDTTLASGAVVQISADSTTDALALTGGSTFNIGIGAILTTDVATATASGISIADAATLASQSIALFGGASIAAGNAATATASGTLALTDSAATFGLSGTLTANGTSLTNSTISMGDAPSVDLGTLAMSKTSFVTLGAGGSATLLDLTMADSSFTVDNGTTTTAQDISLTNSSITLGSSGLGADLNVTGDISVDASTNPSFINGPGGLGFLGTNQTITVADGVANLDLAVSADPFGADFIKDGPGRLVLNSSDPSTVRVTVSDGELQVDSTIGDVRLTSATSTLAGSGTVGAITGGSPAVGTVAPGANYTANPAGILRSADVTWGPQTTFSVTLASGTPGSPTAGTDYDQLQVTGNIDLGGATLTGTFGSGIQFGDEFTIVSTTNGVVDGKFFEPFAPNVVFIQGQKFTVDYSDPTRVVLRKIRADVALTVISSANPSTFGQPITFTTNIVPEPGAGPVPSTSTVTYSFDGMVQTPDAFVSGNQAVFGPVLLSGGSHAIAVLFNGDPLNFNMQTAALPVQVVEVPVIDPLVVNPLFISPNNSPTIQDTTSITTTVREERSATTWTVDVRNSGGTIVRTFTGSGVISINTFPIAAIWNGRDNAGALVADGIYAVTATFLDIWNNTATTAAVAVTVDNTSPTSTPVVVGSTIIAPGTTATVPTTSSLTSTITETNIDTWTVNVFNSANTIVRSFSGNGATVNPSWDGRDGLGTIVPDGNYTVSLSVLDLAGNTYTSAASGIVVLTQPPAITVASTSTNVYGQTSTLTANVTVANPTVVDRLNGTLIQFFNGTTPIGAPVALALVGGQYVASVVTGPLNAGSYSITASYLGTVNFLPSTSAAFTLVVTPAPLNVTALNQTKVYGAPLPPLNFTATGFVNGDLQGDVLSGALTTTATAASSVGVYPITQGTLAANSNYTITFVPATLSVTPAPLLVTADNQIRFYGAPNPTLTFATVGLVNGDTVAGVLTGSPATAAVADSPAGRVFPITRGTLTANANYTLQFVGATLTIVAAPLTVVANDQVKSYGSPVPPLTFVTTGLANNETVAEVVFGGLATTATAASSVGTYPITLGTLVTNANYDLTFVPGILTVTPATLTVAAKDQTSTYGDPVPPLTFFFSGLVNGDTAAAVISGAPVTVAAAGSPVGDYPITQGTIAVTANYALAFVPGLLTVTPAPVTVTANDATSFLGKPLPPFTFEVTGLVNNDTVAGVFTGALGTTFTPTSPVGKYAITQGTLAPNANYTVNFVPGILEILQQPLLVGFPQFLVGADDGRTDVLFYDPDLTVRLFSASFLATEFGARVASADFTGDRVPDIVISSGPGRTTAVQVIDGANEKTIFLIEPFESTFTGGVYVSAGDLTGDGIAELVITPDEGGGPRVRVFNGATKFSLVADFFGIDDPNFRGGARSAVGDLSGDGIGDLVVVAGFGGGPRVAGYNGPSVGSAGGPVKLFNDFFAFEQTLRNGVYIAVGDINGDGAADIIAGGGPDGGPRILAFDGKSLLGSNVQFPIANFFGGDPDTRGGIRVTVKDLDGDTRADLVVGSGVGSGSRVTSYLGRNIAPVGLPAAEFDFDVFPGFTGGIFVG